MNLRDRPFAVWGLPLFMLVLALIVLGADVGGLATRLRGTVFDSYTKLAPRLYEDARTVGTPVRVLDIDATSISRYGSWPWSQATMASLIDAAKRRGAAVIVVVGSFDRPEAAAPRNLVGLIPPGPTYAIARATLERLPSPDKALANALAGTRSVTGFLLMKDTSGVVQPPRLKSTVSFTNTRDALNRVPAFNRAANSLENISDASSGLGAVNLHTDSDGVVRRMPLVFRVGDQAVPSLDAEVLRLVENKTSLVLRSDDGAGGLFGASPGVGGVETQRGEQTTAPDGSVWLSFAGPNPQRMVSAAALAEGEVPADSLRDAILYIGAPDALVMTPQGLRSVAELHAEAAENLLLGTVLRRPATAVQAELLCLLLLGAGCAFLIGRLGVGWAAAFVGAVTLTSGYISWRLYVGEHVLFDALGIDTGLWAVWLMGAGARGIEYLRNRSRLRRAFTDVLPPRVIDVIARRLEPMKLEGETRTVTYLACGVRGFSELAASFRRDPAAFTRLMQRVLDPLMSQALDHGGAIDKLTPDGFTAFWNAPLDDPEHAVHACEAATGMMEAIARTNEIITHERRIDGVALSPVEIGIGVSTGPAIAGGFEVHGRTTYSVNGDCAIRARRVQQLSAQYGPAIVVSEEARKASERGFAFLEVDYIAVERHGDPVKLFALLGNPVMRASPKFRALATFHDHIFQSMRDQQWSKARELIAQCRKLSGASQKLYDLHLTRIAYFEENPPGPDWDGAFRSILQ